MASIRMNCRKIVCVGRNYVDHINELSSARPTKPLFFLKPPSSLLAASAPPPAAGATATGTKRDGDPRSQVIRPRGVTLHHEVELGLIIGRRLKNFRPFQARPESEAGGDGGGSSSSGRRGGGRGREEDEEIDAHLSSAISGYCLAIDFTARNVQNEAIRKGLPWTVAKGFDTFCPVSEEIAVGGTAERKLSQSLLRQRGGPGAAGGSSTTTTTTTNDDKDKVNFWLKVDGVEKQRGDPRSMIFDIPTLLRHISAVMTLEPGDLVLTGTPSGVGPVVGGQRVECGLEVWQGGEEEEEVPGARIEVVVRDADGGAYEYKEEL